MLRKKIWIFCFFGGLLGEIFMTPGQTETIFFLGLSPGYFFSFFSKFWFCWSLEGYKNKKWLKITKKFCLSCPYPKNHILYDHNLCYPSVKWYVSRLFIIFLKMLIFRVVRKVKGQKWPKMTKKLCTLRLISQEPYIMWASFMVHMCKTISPGVLLYFSKILIFGVVK